jgi:hypothetical protein
MRPLFCACGCRSYSVYFVTINILLNNNYDWFNQVYTTFCRIQSYQQTLLIYSLDHFIIVITLWSECKNRSRQTSGWPVKILTIDKISSSLIVAGVKSQWLFLRIKSRADESLITHKLSNIFVFFTLQNMLKCGCLNGYIDLFGILHSFVRLCYGSISGAPFVDNWPSQGLLLSYYVIRRVIMQCCVMLCHVILRHI